MKLEIKNRSQVLHKLEVLTDHWVTKSFTFSFYIYIYLDSPLLVLYTKEIQLLQVLKKYKKTSNTIQIGEERGTSCKTNLCPS